MENEYSRKWLASMGLAIVSSLLFGSAALPQANEVISKSDDFYAAGKFQEAVSLLTQALTKDPDNVVLLNRRATGLERLRRYTDCIADCSRVIKLDPKNAIAYFNRANAEQSMKRWQESIDDARTAGTLQPRLLSGTFLMRAIGQRHLGKYAESVESCNSLLQADNEHRYTALAFQARARAYGLLHEYSKAVADFEEAIKVDSSYQSDAEIAGLLKEYRQLASEKH